MSTESRGQRSALLAVGYGPRCLPVMDVVEAAAGLCDLLWMIDRSLPEMEQMAELLSRYGPVIDIGGLEPDAVAEALAPYRPAGLVTLLDAGMVTFAEVAAHLGLRFHSLHTARGLTDKAAQRQILADAGMTVPTCRVVPEGPGREVIAALAAEVPSWPAVLKPRSAQGSRFTFLTSDPDDAIRLVDALGPDRVDMVLEDFLPDDPARAGGPYAGYVSVESLAAGGEISHLALTGRFPLAENFRETGFFIPAVLDDRDQQAVLDLSTQAIRALGVTTGCLHTEVKFTPDGPRLIEVNGRVGGGIPEMLERAAGAPLIEWLFRAALGEPLRVKGPMVCPRIGYRFFVQPPAVSATVASIEGLAQVTDYPGVSGLSIHQGPGARIDWRDGTRNYILAVVGTASDYTQLQAVDRLLHEAVTVTYRDGTV